MLESCSFYDGYPQIHPTHAPYKGSTFVLIIVLFILFIIVSS
ncbi:YjcZ family sporulation protein [Paenisporosarcina sp. TG-14]